MTTLEKLGLIVLLYGLSLHVAAGPVAPGVPRAPMLAGGTLFVDGGRLTRRRRRKWLGVWWE